LDDKDKAEYEAALAALGDPAAQDNDTVLERLGRLAAKADAYAPIDDLEGSAIRASAGIYRAVWAEASAMRQSGELLRQVHRVTCPVVAIHGDSDSSPAAGVAEPLSALSGFRLITLAQCGHTPWLELYAQYEFYRILLSEIG
jgi:pimeloyl-ACP methyl ester carboxylesterase